MSKHTLGLTTDILLPAIREQRHAAREWELRAMSPEFVEIAEKLQAVASEHFAQMRDMQIALAMVRFPESSASVSLTRVSDDGTVTESDDENATPENVENATPEMSMTELADAIEKVQAETVETPAVTVETEKPAETKPTRNRRNNRKELVSA